MLRIYYTHSLSHSIISLTLCASIADESRIGMRVVNFKPLLLSECVHKEFTSEDWGEF